MVSRGMYAMEEMAHNLNSLNIYIYMTGAKYRLPYVLTVNPLWAH